MFSHVGKILNYRFNFLATQCHHHQQKSFFSIHNKAFFRYLDMAEGTYQRVLVNIKGDNLELETAQFTQVSTGHCY